MAVTFQAVLTAWTAASPSTSAAYTPAVGDTVISYCYDSTNSGRTLTPSGSANSKWTLLNPPGSFSDSVADTHALASQLSAGAVSQTITWTSSTAADTCAGFGWRYSGVAGISSITPIQRTNPGTGAGAITGQAMYVPSGWTMLAICVDVTLSGTAPTAATGTSRQSVTTPEALCLSEFTGTGAPITPTFTSSVGATHGFVVFQILLQPVIGVRGRNDWPGSGPNPHRRWDWSPGAFTAAVSAGTTPLTGVAVATSYGVGNLTGAGALSGVSVATSVGAGDSLTGSEAFSGISVATSVSVGDLRGTNLISGTSVATSVALGNLIGAGVLTGTSVATSVATANLVGAGALSGVSVATSVGIGDLQPAGGSSPISGISIATSVAVGNLTAGGALSGTSVATSYGMGDLRGAGTLSGVSVCTSIAIGGTIAAQSATQPLVFFVGNVGSLLGRM